MFESFFGFLQSVAESIAFKVSESFGLQLSPAKRFMLQLAAFAVIVVPLFLLLAVGAMFLLELIF
ncbi:MAG: hypothetical protein QM772_04730 [Ottowia sp.]|uniref:hypothetical protein n=1 Tax=Ottowia sp. TaxID=1898956 RepID=UPI0039E431A2